MGSALHSLGDGQITNSDEVSESQLQLLIGMGRDPVTGDPLGRAFPEYASVKERIAKRTRALDENLNITDRTREVAKIDVEETARGGQRAVAGFDYTFSVPKSVSVLWGVADAGVQSLIARAHHVAIADVLDFMEREVSATRSGITARDGAVAQVDVTGLIATAFDHYDSRAGDPQLHAHVVVSNKVQTVFDQKWRSLDGRPMHQAVVALSEHYNAILADRLTSLLGVGWEARDRGRDRNHAWEIIGVTEDLIAEFSTRSHDIDAETDRLIDAYITEHGYRPSPTTIVRLRAQATLATRPKKEVHSLDDLATGWREHAAVVLGTDATSWARNLTTEHTARALRADDVPLEHIAAIGSAVVAVVGEKRSTWRKCNLHAEATRQTMGWRFATRHDREAIVGMITDAAEQSSLRFTPPELATSPAVFRRPVDGSSVFRPKHSALFTSETLLSDEDRLLNLAHSTSSPIVDLATIEQITSEADAAGRLLADDQVEALTKIAVSGRALDLLVGPAGAGKTTAMNALRRAWEQEHGSGSVVGLAPSAVPAQVLADDLGITTENTAKWWHEHLTTGASFEGGQLVIIDEASLASTLSLDRITDLAAQADAKVLLVGDYAQLQSVDAGGWAPSNPQSAWQVRPTGQTRGYTPEWVCKSGHRWQATTASRTNGSMCPECSVAGKLRIELAYLDALSGIFPSVHSERLIRSQEFTHARAWRPDILIEADEASRSVIVEYDGSYWHAEKTETDTKKSLDLIAAGYDVIRLREHPLVALPVSSDHYLELVAYGLTDDISRIVAAIDDWMGKPS